MPRGRTVRAYRDNYGGCPGVAVEFLRRPPMDLIELGKRVCLFMALFCAGLLAVTLYNAYVLP